MTDQGRITNGDLGIWSAAHVPPLKRIAEFMKAQNVVPGIQIAHAGRKGSMQRPWFGNGALTPTTSRAARRSGTSSRPTAEPMAEGIIVPRQLSVSDLAALKGHWVDAAKRALEAGFEVLEIHNAHGYLMHTFLSPLVQQAQRRLRRRLRRAARAFPSRWRRPCARPGPRTSRCSCASPPSTAWTAAGPWTTRSPTPRSSRRAAST